MTSFPCGDVSFEVPTDHASRVALQREIADRAAWSPSGEEVLADGAVVVGVDQAFRDDEAVSAAVAMCGDDVVDRSIASAPLPMPYVPGLLAYREGPAICAALDGLDADPDAVLFDGSGRIHPREAGIATHVGVLRDLRTVGVAKSLLCGRPHRSLDAPLEQGECVAIEADEDVEVAAGTVIGHAYQSRQYADTRSQWINPLYVSPGHRIDAETAVDLVAAWCWEHKLPEPIRLADAAVADRT